MLQQQGTAYQMGAMSGGYGGYGGYGGAFGAGGYPSNLGAGLSVTGSFGAGLW
jgi:hypothetical protein